MENLKRQNHGITIEERYNNVRLRGNELELYLRQPVVTIEKLSVSIYSYINLGLFTNMTSTVTSKYIMLRDKLNIRA